MSVGKGEGINTQKREKSKGKERRNVIPVCVS